MKKNFLKSAILMMALGMAFVSCQDDVADELTLGTGEDGAKEVTINRIGGIIELPIVTNTEWKASLPADCDWVGLSDSIGTGNHTLEIFVDYNDPRFAEERRVDLVVTAGNLIKTIRVRQYAGITDGENSAYINDSVGFNDLYFTRGLGCGINISPVSEGDMVRSPLFSKPLLDVLATKNTIYEGIIAESTDPRLIGRVGVRDTLATTPQGLNIDAAINVTYGLFKLDIKGTYKMGHSHTKNNYKYDVSYVVPRVQASADVPTLRTLLNNKDLAMYAFTPGFLEDRQNIIDKLEQLTDEELDKLVTGDPVAWESSRKVRNINNAISLLNDDYGAAFVTSARLGGSCTMSIECDTTALLDTTIVTGSIKTAIEAGLLTVKADVAASYYNISDSILRKASYAFEIRGGSAETNKNLTQSLNLETTQINSAAINNELGAWIGTIPTNLTSEEAMQNMAVIDYGYRPIWNLFGDYYDVVRGWYLMKYKDKKTFIDIDKL